MDYFRCTPDRRLLFGGTISATGCDLLDHIEPTRRRMLKVFPQLQNTRIDFAWDGLLDVTVNRAVDFGRTADNVYYLQGFSGHGIAMTTMAGTLVAQTINGQASRFDVFGKIQHLKLPNVSFVKATARMIGVLWARLRDAI
jgi:gamma-glutamylputrescine oxidase